MEPSPIETLTEQVCHELDAWFDTERCETLARKTGFIRHGTRRLTGSDFFKSNMYPTADAAAPVNPIRHINRFEGLCSVQRI
jgi:hypothetical protein